MSLRGSATSPTHVRDVARHRHIVAAVSVNSISRPQFVRPEFSSGNRADEIQLLEFTGVEFVGWNSPVAILQGLPVGIRMCWNSRAARDASAIGVLKN